MFSNGVSLADIAAVTGRNRDNDGMWGNGAWWIVILLIFGWGGFCNNGCGNGNGMGSTAAAYTDSAIQRGFDNQAVVSKLDGITNGLCDGFYAVNNSMLTGFNGINTIPLNILVWAVVECYRPICKNKGRDKNLCLIFYFIKIL